MDFPAMFDPAKTAGYMERHLHHSTNLPQFETLLNFLGRWSGGWLRHSRTSDQANCGFSTFQMFQSLIPKSISKFDTNNQQILAIPSATCLPWHYHGTSGIENTSSFAAMNSQAIGPWKLWHTSPWSRCCIDHTAQLKWGIPAYAAKCCQDTPSPIITCFEHDLQLLSVPMMWITASALNISCGRASITCHFQNLIRASSL